MAIAYGYNSIAQSEPRIWGAGSELPLSQLSEALRLEAAMAGFTEVCRTAEPGSSIMLAERRCCSSACSMAFALKFVHGPACLAGSPALLIGPCFCASRGGPYKEACYAQGLAWALSSHACIIGCNALIVRWHVLLERPARPT